MIKITHLTDVNSFCKALNRLKNKLFIKLYKMLQA